MRSEDARFAYAFEEIQSRWRFDQCVRPEDIDTLIARVETLQQRLTGAESVRDAAIELHDTRLAHLSAQLTALRERAEKAEGENAHIREILGAGPEGDIVAHAISVQEKAGLSCGAVPGADSWFSCTLPQGHDGPHVAHGTNADALATWDDARRDA